MTDEDRAKTEKAIQGVKEYFNKLFSVDKNPNPKFVAPPAKRPYIPDPPDAAERIRRATARTELLYPILSMGEYQK